MPHTAAGRIGVLTGGGDCPGLNAVVRAVTKTAIHRFGMKVVGISDGFGGLIHGKWSELTDRGVSGILHRGGTILGTTNRGNPFRYLIREDENGKVYADFSNVVVENFH
ncbi:6-phosphofructokinase [Candidatus Solincola sp.]